MDTLIHKIFQAFAHHGSNESVSIGGESYTYDELNHLVAAVQEILSKQSTTSNELMAVYCADTIDSYACILGLWFSGLAYLPITPTIPEERVLEILDEAQVTKVLVPNGYEGFLSRQKGIHCIELTSDRSKSAIRYPKALLDDDLMYVLFTSGSTGVPKGVPISRRNLDAFVNAFFELGYQIDHRDRFLQMFEFTFDVSAQCFVLPFSLGATVCHVPKTGVRFLQTLKTLKEQNVTIAKMVPSTVQFLKPYFEEIALPELRYSLFSGEGLSLELMKEWAIIVPKATIQNFYGPTEATIDCTFYTYTGPLENKAENDILTIGKPFGDTRILIVDEKNKEVKEGEKGELCVFGNQVTKGYLNNPEKNNDAFFISDSAERFYKTGDLVFLDADGDIQYCGRLDDQVQIQGHRVELDEISYRVKKITGVASKALAVRNDNGLWEIHLAIESEKVNLTELLKALKKQLPGYMIPVKTYVISAFPLNANGKLDKTQLKQKIGIL